MMYFILWVIFLLIVILSVPVANWLENRARRAAMGPMLQEMEAEAAEAEESAEEAEPEEKDAFGGAEVEEVGEAVFEETNDDEFAGFE